MGTGARTFVRLLHKNILLKMRSPVATICEFILPIVFLVRRAEKGAGRPRQLSGHERAEARGGALCQPSAARAQLAEGAND
jgi:hypothetical protein